MELDLSEVADVQNFESIPPGRYACEVAEVREYRLEDGSPRWSLRWNVLEGQWAGRIAAWDSLIFTERGLPRVKFVLARLGFGVDGCLNLTPQGLIGARAWVVVRQEEFTDSETGARRIASKVPFSGYSAFGADPPQATSEEVAPF